MPSTVVSVMVCSYTKAVNVPVDRLRISRPMPRPWLSSRKWDVLGVSTHEAMLEAVQA